ncbi:MAG: hypothetical protein ACXADY_21760 [Candidatus Hodarchaeales archaeon]|jgi:S-adenosylhomocysteine hydrolase
MVTIEEKEGNSMEEAIVIANVGHFEGLDVEYQYLEKLFGKRGIDWKLIQQTLLSEGNKIYDKIELELVDQTSVTIYFDITAFYGKGF